MRVNNPANSPVQSSETSGPSKSGKAGKAQRSGESSGASGSSSADASSGAKTEISSKARDMAKAKDVASAAPDVREDRIAELKRRIAEGSYKVNADAIADRLVDDHLKTGIG